MGFKSCIKQKFIYAQKEQERWTQRKNERKKTTDVKVGKFVKIKVLFCTINRSKFIHKQLYFIH